MFRRWCEVTSCNGVIDLLESKDSRNPFKICFWTVVMIGMLFASVWFTYRTVQGYIDSPFVTTVSTVISRTMPLPQVLICYNGGLNVKTMQSEHVSETLIKDLSTVLVKQKFERNSSVSHFENYMMSKSLSFKGVLNMFGYDCSDMVQSFDSPFLNNYPSDVACKNATTLYTDLGKCYLFPQNGNQTWPGLYGGISINLQQPPNSFFEHYPDEAKEVLMYNGFSISLEKDMGLQFNGKSLIIPLNSKVEITLNVKRFVRLQQDSKCETSPMYSNSNTCYYKCYNKEVNRFCGCTSSALWDEADSSVGIKMCDPFLIATNCSDSLLNFDNVMACQRACKPICDEWIFETSLTYVTVGPSTQQNQTSTSIISIAYTTMQYTKIEEVNAFTIDMAIANFGGQAGLWLGASIVTVIQAVYFLILAVVNKIGLLPSQVKPFLKKQPGKTYEQGIKDESFKKRRRNKRKSVP